MIENDYGHVNNEKTGYACASPDTPNAATLEAGFLPQDLFHYFFLKIRR